MTRLLCLPLLLTLACATMHPRPVPDQGSGGSVPHANYLLQSIEGQAMAPVGSPSWFGKAYSLTLSAPSGQRGVQLTTGAFLDLGGGANDYLYSDGSALRVAGDSIFAGVIYASNPLNVRMTMQNDTANQPLTTNDAEGFGLVGVPAASLPTCNTTAPPTGTRGTIQYDTTNNSMKFCNGTAWTAM